MSGFVLHPNALTDLTEIWEYIAADSPSAADRVLGEIQEAIRALVTFPQLGHIRADLTSRPLRFQLVRDLLIATPRKKTPSLSWLYSMVAAIPGLSQPSYVQESELQNGHHRLL